MNTLDKKRAVAALLQDVPPNGIRVIHGLLDGQSYTMVLRRRLLYSADRSYPIEWLPIDTAELSASDQGPVTSDRGGE